ncbi:uncharacterized protein BX664DRAFT_317841 [Halteromyces radiatus]|uniref:uncharacterized protein n=1 Tax=Halteromyces radiatus TaxID=101107 RepID=UPI00221F6895|nr:uncharacterized protein BX664DRAFT_317841 [Halteromyces radiatus]KAI8079949.1 hypothetical protein BX664DRAFT_317841 [Halteromyces radiatus]
MADINMVNIMNDFLNASNFSRFHQYRLESHGIIQVGLHIQRQPDVPPRFYDEVVLENKPPVFPISRFSNYLRSTLFNDDYGTRSLAPTIFSRTKIDSSEVTEMEITFIMCSLFVVCDTLNGMKCNFKVGETPLTAMKSLSPSLSGYSADGTVSLEDTGAYGSYTMLHAILKKYPYADKELINDLRILFLHASAKDNHVRLWVMKPCHNGTAITFERMDKVTITTNKNDKGDAIELIKFFWQLKGMLERSRAAINNLKNSSDTNILLMQGDDTEPKPSFLPSLLKPRSMKSKYDNDCERNS